MTRPLVSSRNAPQWQEVSAFLQVQAVRRTAPHDGKRSAAGGAGGRWLGRVSALLSQHLRLSPHGNHGEILTTAGSSTPSPFPL